MHNDTNKLKELAELATPTGWTHDADRYVVAQSDQVNDGWNICLCEGPDSKKNRDFIAAANPKAVLALLDEIDRLKAENDALRGALQAVVDDPTWRSNDNTLWPKIIKAMDKGATQ
ncbi:TPA: ead/Ea22-like family protein [Pseudomonas aeruginosa]